MVLGLQLSKQPNFQNCLELLKDRDKRQKWRQLLFRVAFAMPPDHLLSVSRSIIQQQDVESAPGKSKKQAADRTPGQVPEVSGSWADFIFSLW